MTPCDGMCDQPYCESRDRQWSTPTEDIKAGGKLWTTADVEFLGIELGGKCCLRKDKVRVKMPGGSIVEVPIGGTLTVRVSVDLEKK